MTDAEILRRIERRDRRRRAVELTVNTIGAVIGLGLGLAAVGVWVMHLTGIPCLPPA